MRSFIQAFIAGSIVPALGVLTFIALLASQGALHVLRAYPLHYLPFIWGAWNVLYYYIGRHVPLLKKLGLWGALLGLGISLLGVFQFHTLEFYQRILSTTTVSLYQVLVLDAVLYFFLWESIVRYCDRILID